MKRRTFLSSVGLLGLNEVLAPAKSAKLLGLARGSIMSAPENFGLSNANLTKALSANAETADVSNRNLIGENAFRVDLLPFLRRATETHQFCSYDRAGDNYDFEYFPLYMQPDGECVIFDAFGPGCLSRHHMNIWYDNAIYKSVEIRYYFDDEPRPRIAMDISLFFSEQNALGIFQAPLGYNGKNRFRILYHPMFFKKRLKVCLSTIPGGGPAVVESPWTKRYSSVPVPRHHWYEYTYQTYGEDQGLESWDPATGRRMMPALLSAMNSDHEVKANEPHAGGEESMAHLLLSPGKTATIWEKNGEAGSIAALRIKIDPSNEADSVFNTWLRITFDGAANPQIEAPLGCFFGAYRTSLGDSYRSLLLGYSNGEGFCNFPMPFWRSATLQVDNQGQSEISVGVTVEYKPTSSMSYPRQRCGYLWARYHRESPRIEGRDYTYLQTAGAGQVVGHVVMRWNTSMEEDERTYIDGNATPWIVGEGFEDDHGMGWGLQNLTEPLFGATSAKGGSGAIYRFLFPDMYCFYNGIKYGHQTYGPHSPLGHEGMYQVGEEESVAFWYGSSEPRLIQTDELDIGDAQSEAAHSYQVRGQMERVKGKYWYDGEFNDVLIKTPPIEDDGVSFKGSSSFTVAISPENRGVRLRRRCDKANNRQKARVFIDGRMITERPWYSVDYERTYRDIRWLDSDFEIPAQYTEGKSRITVRIEFVSSKSGRWDEYRYWVDCYRDFDPKPIN